MNEETKKRYLSQAEYFIQNRTYDHKTATAEQAAEFEQQGLRERTPKGIADALAACAEEYRPDSWRKLRCALVTHQHARGHTKTAERIRAVENNVTKKGSGKKAKPKRPKAKKISQEDYSQLLSAAGKDPESGVLAAVGIANILGCRPAEMLSIKAEGNTVTIIGAKKRADRGLDRVLTLSEGLVAIVADCVAILNNVKPGKTGRMRKVQDALDRLTKKLWPRRKVRPTLYTLRHQLGSDLKNSSLSKKERAYVMGHKSTKSLDAYGDRRSGGKGRALKPGIAIEEVNKLVRDPDEDTNAPSRYKGASSIPSEELKPVC